MGIRKGAILIPQRAVSDVQGKLMVAVVGSDNKVDIRQVKVGERIGSDWIITEGLKPGETIVVEGTQKARPGAVVNPKPFNPTAPAAAPETKPAAPAADKKKG
jgi:membrane fusion protein (multidrug efflux system)